ncbi:hypothetical protein KW783_04065 [Candidatus Parcubacteria bacterium]|nr:hypothetical protein [Candidatus Parcubacteria bacterium]
MSLTFWQFFLTSHDAWDAMFRACERAKFSIDCEEYILSNDRIGRSFCNILIKKSREGVKVRLLCDAAGSYSFYMSSLPEELRAAGIDVRFFNEISPWRINNFFSWFFRDHRKILIVDSEVALTGGVGFRDDMRYWRDTHIEVTGRIVREMEHSFLELWNQAANKRFLSRLRRLRSYTKGFNFLTNSPFFRKRFLYQTFVDALRNARSYIFLTTPYFVPDARIIRVLRLAARRGVDVRILLPVSSDVVWVDRAAHAHFETLLKSGVRIFEYRKTFLHAKTAVIDDEWATVGSFNLDYLSFFYNYEANIVSTDSKFVDAVRNHFEIDCIDTTEIDEMAWKRRPFTAKIPEFFSRFFKRFL